MCIPFHLPPVLYGISTQCDLHISCSGKYITGMWKIRGLHEKTTGKSETFYVLESLCGLRWRYVHVHAQKLLKLQHWWWLCGLHRDVYRKVSMRQPPIPVGGPALSILRPPLGCGSQGQLECPDFPSKKTACTSVCTVHTLPLACCWICLLNNMYTSNHTCRRGYAHTK